MSAITKINVSVQTEIDNSNQDDKRERAEYAAAFSEYVDANQGAAVDDYDNRTPVAWW